MQVITVSFHSNPLYFSLLCPFRHIMTSNNTFSFQIQFHIMASFDRLFYFGSFSVGKASPGGAGGLWPLCERLFLLFGYEQAPSCRQWVICTDRHREAKFRNNRMWSHNSYPLSWGWGYNLTFPMSIVTNFS